MILFCSANVIYAAAIDRRIYYYECIAYKQCMYVVASKKKKATYIITPRKFNCCNIRIYEYVWTDLHCVIGAGICCPNNTFSSSTRLRCSSALLIATGCPRVMFAKAVLRRCTSNSLSSMLFSIINFLIVTGFV